MVFIINGILSIYDDLLLCKTIYLFIKMLVPCYRGVMELIGILIGHLAFFLLFKYPQEFGGPAILTPPDFM